MSEGQTVSDNHAYEAPTRQILQMQDMAKWRTSEAYHEYRGFLGELNEAVRGKAISSTYPSSPAVQSMLDLLDELDKWIELYPPAQQMERFGNRSYREWYQHLNKECGNVLRKCLPERLHGAIVELRPYLADGFGNEVRIDYGTGHEMSFLWLLSCLFKIGFFALDDKCAVVLRIFDRYLILVRRLQSTYRMEPAGTRGVWSLDDYQFIPFFWGSSQLIGHDVIEPKSFIIPEVVERHHKDYLFLSAIKFINSQKTGPFFEHSNQLFNVSGVPSWEKVNQGLLRMYDDQVLNKFPVVQHIVFGSLMSIAPGKPRSAVRGPPRVSAVNLPPPGPVKL